MPVIVPSRGAELGESVIAATQQQPNLTAQSALALLSQIESLDTLLSATDDKTSIGSNNWVVAGSRTTTGKPILSNDPHLGIQMPSIWYQIGLHCRTVSAACPYDVVGVSFPGTPGVIVGHNQRIAWGVTNVGPDVHDLFIEKQNPSNANEFEFMGKYEPAQVIDEVINVAGEAPVSLKVRVTRHGPIMNDVSDLLKDQAPIAYRWTALENNKLFQSVLQIDKAQNWTDFRNALRSWDVPSQNFVYADVDGNIGYQTPGKIPMRAKGDGTVAVSGWSGEYEWTGYIPFEELPSSFNPPEGYIVTANNAVVDGKYKYNLGKDWDYGYRAREIVNRITAKEKLSVEDMRNIQFDSYSGTAQDLLPQLKSLQPNFGADATAQAAWQKMIAWDGKSVRDSVGATIFETFWNKLAHQIFDDDLGADLAKRVIGMGTANRTAVRNMIGNTSAKWWDDITTQGKTETRDDIVVRAMQATATQLKDKLGADVNAWTWGKLHTATFKNQSLGSSGIAPIEQLLNRGPYAADGATAAVNAVSHGESMIVSSVPSLRIVMDVSDWRNSKMIHTTGQSGHTMNAHYDDMIDSWLNSKANPLLWARADIDANSEGTLHLLPQTN
jgi:penicillin amidase